MTAAQHQRQYILYLHTRHTYGNCVMSNNPNPNPSPTPTLLYSGRRPVRDGRTDGRTDGQTDGRTVVGRGKRLAHISLRQQAKVKYSRPSTSTTTTTGRYLPTYLLHILLPTRNRKTNCRPAGCYHTRNYTHTHTCIYRYTHTHSSLSDLVHMYIPTTLLSIYFCTAGNGWGVERGPVTFL